MLAPSFSASCSSSPIAIFSRCFARMFSCMRGQVSETSFVRGLLDHLDNVVQTRVTVGSKCFLALRNFLIILCSRGVAVTERTGIAALVRGPSSRRVRPFLHHSFGVLTFFSSAAHHCPKFAEKGVQSHPVITMLICHQILLL